MDGLQNTHGGYKDIMMSNQKSALRHLGRDYQRAAEGCDTSRQEILSSLRAAFQRFSAQVFWADSDKLILHFLPATCSNQVPTTGIAPTASLTPISSHWLAIAWISCGRPKVVGVVSTNGRSRPASGPRRAALSPSRGRRGSARRAPRRSRANDGALVCAVGVPGVGVERVDDRRAVDRVVERLADPLVFSSGAISRLAVGEHDPWKAEGAGRSLSPADLAVGMLLALPSIRVGLARLHRPERGVGVGDHADHDSSPVDPVAVPVLGVRDVGVVVVGDGRVGIELVGPAPKVPLPSVSGFG